MPVDEINDPVGYWGGWLAVGIVAVVLAVAIVVAVFLVTRGPRRPTSPAPTPPPVPGTDPYAALRVATINRIERLAAQHAAGEIDDRALHLGLSGAARSFAGGRLGIDTRALTLVEIAQRPDGEALADMVTHYYRPSFADGEELRLRPGIDPSESIRLARDVVIAW